MTHFCALALAAAGFGFLQECADMLVNTLVVLHFETDEPELHLQLLDKMTCLTSLSLGGQHTYNDDQDEQGWTAGDKLTLLHSLANLHTLDLFIFLEPNLNLERLQSLRKLSIAKCHIDFCDMTSCTQLTSLAITWDLRKGSTDIGVRQPRRLLLPTGSNVQLQHLSISAVFRGVDCFQELQNLQDATRLRSIEFHHTYPGNLNDGDWPVYMPNLNTIKADMLPGWPPQQLVDYDQLRHLDIQMYAGDVTSFPTWFSQFTQLDTVRVLAFDGLSEFPVCLLHLKQLSSVNLGYGIDLRRNRTVLPVHCSHQS